MKVEVLIKNFCSCVAENRIVDAIDLFEDYVLRHPHIVKTEPSPFVDVYCAMFHALTEFKESRLLEFDFADLLWNMQIVDLHAATINFARCLAKSGDRACKPRSPTRRKRIIV